MAGKAAWPHSLHAEHDVLGIDCEMVGVAVPGRPGSNWRSTLCRVSVVSHSRDWHCHVHLDTWVEVEGTVMDWRSSITGLDGQSFAAKDKMSFDDVKARVQALIAGKIVVGHAVWNDLQALMISHPEHLIRDTALYDGLRPPWWHQDKLPSLKMLAKTWLEENIQNAGHDSVDDASISLKLYSMHQEGWEQSFGNACSVHADGGISIWVAGQGWSATEAQKVQIWEMQKMQMQALLFRSLAAQSWRGQLWNQWPAAAPAADFFSSSPYPSESLELSAHLFN